MEKLCCTEKKKYHNKANQYCLCLIYSYTDSVLTLPLTSGCLNGLVDRALTPSVESLAGQGTDWKLTPATSLVSIHHWRSRAGLVGPVSV